MKKAVLIGILCFFVFCIQACIVKDRNKGIPNVRYEAEDAGIQGNITEATDKKDYSGESYVTGFTDDGDKITFNILNDEDGFYDLCFGAAGIGGRKENSVYIDGKCEGSLITDQSEDFQESVLKRVYLTSGKHKITLKKDWGWLALDYLQLRKSSPLDSGIYQVKAVLADREADECAEKLMDYLCSIYGFQMLSGQYSLNGPDGEEMQIIYRLTGEKPAILGMDMRDYSVSAREHGAEPEVINWAEEYFNEGGIISLSWHWLVPEQYVMGEWWEALYAEETSISLKNVLDGKDEEGYRLLMKDLDAVGSALMELQKKNIPILWRPLHEGSGGWFWWSKDGAEYYKKLWRLMFDKFTREYGLHNLIWVYSGMDKEWYPGDNYVDIIGEDIYPDKRCSSVQSDKFINALSYPKENKLIMLSECGFLPDPDNIDKDRGCWLGCVLWGEDYVIKKAGSGRYSETYVSKKLIKDYYSHSKIITLSELPDYT